MSQFFISYKREEKPFALLVKEKIEEDGHLGWIDENIQGGKKWKVVIDNAIRASLGVIVIVSPASMNSQYVTYEWAFALGLGKPVIPVIYAYPGPSQVHPQLQDLHQWNFTNSRNRPWKKLLKNLRDIDQEQFVPPMVERALETLLYQFDDSLWPPAIKTLERYPSDKAADALVQCIAHDMADISFQATVAFANKTNYSDVRAIPGLRRVIANSTDPASIRSVVDILGQIGTTECVEILVDAYDKPEIHQVADSKIFKNLAKLKNPLSAEFFRNIVRRTSGDQNWTQTSISILGEFNDKTILPDLMNILSKPDYYRPAWDEAARVVGDIGDTSVARELIGLMDQYIRTEPNRLFSPILDVLVRVADEDTIAYLENRSQAIRYDWVSQAIAKRLAQRKRSSS